MDRESIGLLVRKEYGANTVEVEAVRPEKSLIRSGRRTRTSICLNFTEQAGYIREAINTTIEEIIEGAILAFLTLLLSAAVEIASDH